jgi:ubiquinone/menaquinone biosynthesis C-methylase UbiE
MKLKRVFGIGVATVLASAGLLLYAGFGAFLPWRERAEAERLAAIAGVTDGTVVADIGAGSGRFTELLAGRVGERGRIYSTEISEENREIILTRVQKAGLRNVSVVEAASEATNLPDRCCDVLLLRNVYHHISNPEVFAASLARALRPDGRLVLIDFEPGAMWFVRGRPDGAAERRTGHGVSRQHVKKEMASAGFRLEREIPEWSGPMWLMLFQLQGPAQQHGTNRETGAN